MHTATFHNNNIMNDVTVTCLLVTLQGIYKKYHYSAMVCYHRVDMNKKRVRVSLIRVIITLSNNGNNGWINNSCNINGCNNNGSNNDEYKILESLKTVTIMIIIVVVGLKCVMLRKSM